MHLKIKIFLSILISALVWGVFAFWSLTSEFYAEKIPRQLVESQSLLLSSLASEFSQKAYGHMLSLSSAESIKGGPLKFLFKKDNSNRTNFWSNSELKVDQRQFEKWIKNLKFSNLKKNQRDEIFLWINLSDLSNHQALVVQNKNYLMLGVFESSFFQTLSGLLPQNFFLVNSKGFVIADKSNSYAGSNLLNHSVYADFFEKKETRDFEKVAKGDYFFQKVPQTNLFVFIPDNFPSLYSSKINWLKFSLGLALVSLLLWFLIVRSLSSLRLSLEKIAQNISLLNKGADLKISKINFAPKGLIENLNSLKRKLDIPLLSEDLSEPQPQPQQESFSYEQDLALDLFSKRSRDSENFTEKRSRD